MLHETTIADALRTGTPAVVIFATPAFCESRFCGPITDVIQDLAERYSDRAEFIHVEIYREYEQGNVVVNQAAADWLLRNGDLTEPWILPHRSRRDDPGPVGGARSAAKISSPSSRPSRSSTADGPARGRKSPREPSVGWVRVRGRPTSRPGSDDGVLLSPSPDGDRRALHALREADLHRVHDRGARRVPVPRVRRPGARRIPARSRTRAPRRRERHEGPPRRDRDPVRPRDRQGRADLDDEPGRPRCCSTSVRCSRSRSRRASTGACSPRCSSTSGSCTSRSTRTRCGSSARWSNATTDACRCCSSTSCPGSSRASLRTCGRSRRTLSVGASGAIFGIFGAFFVYNYRRRHTALGSANLRTALSLLVLNAILAFSISGIDWRAHVGGFVAGVACGLVSEGWGPPAPAPRDPRRRVRRAARDRHRARGLPVEPAPRGVHRDPRDWGDPESSG